MSSVSWLLIRVVRVPIKTFHLCECGVDLNAHGSRLTFSTLRNKVHMGCTSTLLVPCSEWKSLPRFQYQSHIDHEVRGLAETICGSEQ